MPFVQLSGGFTIGNNGEGELPQVGNSFQWSDSLSKVMGNHSFKFGGDVRRQRFDQTLYFDVNGEFFFDGTSSQYSWHRHSFPRLPARVSRFVWTRLRPSGERPQHLVYLFAQDSWKIKPNLTLNYGLRWELNTPIADIGHHVQTFRPGQNSTSILAS